LEFELSVKSDLESQVSKESSRAEELSKELSELRLNLDEFSKDQTVLGQTEDAKSQQIQSLTDGNKMLLEKIDQHSAQLDQQKEMYEGEVRKQEQIILQHLAEITSQRSIIESSKQESNKWKELHQSLHNETELLKEDVVKAGEALEEREQILVGRNDEILKLKGEIIDLHESLEGFQDEVDTRINEALNHQQIAHGEELADVKLKSVEAFVVKQKECVERILNRYHNYVLQSPHIEKGKTQKEGVDEEDVTLILKRAHNLELLRNGEEEMLGNFQLGEDFLLREKDLSGEDGGEMEVVSMLRSHLRRTELYRYALANALGVRTIMEEQHQEQEKELKNNITDLQKSLTTGREVREQERQELSQLKQTSVEQLRQYQDDLMFKSTEINSLKVELERFSGGKEVELSQYKQDVERLLREKEVKKEEYRLLYEEKSKLERQLERKDYEHASQLRAASASIERSGRSPGRGRSSSLKRQGAIVFDERHEQLKQEITSANDTLQKSLQEENESTTKLTKLNEYLLKSTQILNNFHELKSKSRKEFEVQSQKHRLTILNAELTRAKKMKREQQLQDLKLEISEQSEKVFMAENTSLQAFGEMEEVDFLNIARDQALFQLFPMSPGGAKVDKKIIEKSEKKLVSVAEECAKTWKLWTEADVRCDELKEEISKCEMGMVKLGEYCGSLRQHISVLESQLSDSVNQPYETDQSRTARRAREQRLSAEVERLTQTNQQLSILQSIGGGPSGPRSPPHLSRGVSSSADVEVSALAPMPSPASAVEVSAPSPQAHEYEQQQQHEEPEPIEATSSTQPPKSYVSHLSRPKPETLQQIQTNVNNLVEKALASPRNVWAAAARSPRMQKLMEEGGKVARSESFVVFVLLTVVVGMVGLIMGSKEEGFDSGVGIFTTYVGESYVSVTTSVGETYTSFTDSVSDTFTWSTPEEEEKKEEEAEPASPSSLVARPRHAIKKSADDHRNPTVTVRPQKKEANTNKPAASWKEEENVPTTTTTNDGPSFLTQWSDSVSESVSSTWSSFKSTVSDARDSVKSVASSVASTIKDAIPKSSPTAKATTTTQQVTVSPEQQSAAAYNARQMALLEQQRRQKGIWDERSEAQYVATKMLSNLILLASLEKSTAYIQRAQQQASEMTDAQRQRQAQHMRRPEVGSYQNGNEVSVFLLSLICMRD
jgi:hypothetical protein